MTATAETLRFSHVDGWDRAPQDVARGDGSGVAVDARGRVYLLTRADARVLVYDPGGRLEAMWGQDVLSVRPHGIATGPDDTIYVVDEGRHVVCRFTADGRLLQTIGVAQTPSDSGYDGRTLASIARGAGPFNRPTNLAVGARGDLYVTDGYGNARVHRFDADGRLAGSWGQPGTGPGEFHVPHGVAVAADGRVVVADRENERLQFFTADGAFLTEWTDVRRPTNVALDQAGRLYVSELGYRAGERSQRRGAIAAHEPGRVSVFGADGRLLARWSGAAGGALVAPHDIAVDARGDVYVAEVTRTAFEVVQKRPVPAGCPVVQKFARIA